MRPCRQGWFSDQELQIDELSVKVQGAEKGPVLWITSRLKGPVGTITRMMLLLLRGDCCLWVGLEQVGLLFHLLFPCFITSWKSFSDVHSASLFRKHHFTHYLSGPSQSCLAGIFYSHFNTDGTEA